MKNTIKSIIVCIALVCTTPAIAGGLVVAEKGDSKLKVSSKFFLNATQNKTSDNTGTTAKSTGLAVDRAYLSLQYQIDDIWSMKFTTDAALNTAATGKKTEIFLKNAFIQAKFSPEFQFNLGVISTPWVGYENKLDKHRYMVKAYTDTKKFDSSADAGMGISGKFADGLIGYAAAAINGKGYGDITATNAVDFNTRIGLYPIKGLSFDFQYRTGYLGTKTLNVTGTKSTLLQGMTTFSADKDFRIGVNYINNKKDAASTITTTRAIAAWGWVKFGNDWGAYGRYENSRIKKTAEAINQTENRYVAGLEYFANKHITLSLAGDCAKTSNAGHVAGDNVRKTRFGLYTQAKF